MTGSDNASLDQAMGRYTNVDHGEQQQRAWLLRWLDIQNGMRTFQEPKREMLDLLALQPGLSILDIGCGTGDETRVLAERVGPTGHVVGIDVSAFMVEEAQRRTAGTALPVTFALGDVQRLDYDDNTFDRCRCERVLQHVPDPARAIQEMVRVTKPGGRIVVADADWTTTVSTEPIMKASLDFNAGTIGSPTIGRDLGGLFRECGLREITVQPHLTGFLGNEVTPEIVQMWQPVVTSAQAAGVVSVEDGTRWHTKYLQDGRDGIAFSLVAYFVVAGTKQ